MFKNFLSNIPPNRAVIYLMSLGCLPLIFVFLLFISQKNEIAELRSGLVSIQDQAFIKEKKQAQNLAVRRHYQEADRFYIDKYLETIVFLEPEIEMLQKVASDKNFADDERVKKRIEFLTSGANHLVFSEGVVQAYPHFQETVETQVHPVEINETDLQKILSLIEGCLIKPFTPAPHLPQLLITDFKLDKKKVNDKSEVFVLNLKLLKREFL